MESEYVENYFQTLSNEGGCSDESLNLYALDLLKDNFPKNTIGLSDHSIGLTAGIISAARGYSYFERHFTLDKDDDGPDHYASSDVKEMKKAANSHKCDEYNDTNQKPLTRPLQLGKRHTVCASINLLLIRACD